MTRTARRPGLVLAAGLAVVLAAALAPAGLRGEGVPVASWVLWAAVFAAALAAFRAAGWTPRSSLARTLQLVPFVALLAVPAGILAAPDRRVWLVLALACRALSAAAAGSALAAWLGPQGIVRGARALGLPGRLTDVLAATLASIATVTRNVQTMLRAREARRPGRGAMPLLLASPPEAVKNFGRLVAALLLRSLERAEAVDRARRARGAGEP